MRNEKQYEWKPKKGEELARVLRSLSRAQPLGKRPNWSERQHPSKLLKAKNCATLVVYLKLIK